MVRQCARIFKVTGSNRGLNVLIELLTFGYVDCRLLRMIRNWPVNSSDIKKVYRDFPGYPKKEEEEEEKIGFDEL